MDLRKSYEFFQPEKVQKRIHLIGCGSVGSTLAELLVRFGLSKITLYDFDEVKPHNLANQMFTQADVGKLKVEAVAERLLAINPMIKKDLKIVKEGWQGETLSGYIFLAVDNIELRQKIFKQHEHNRFVKGMFDFRTRLTDAQHYAADWSKLEEKENFWKSMDFTSEEAEAGTQVSACGTSLCVAPTVWNICTAGVANFVNFVLGKGLKTMILQDSFDFYIESYS